MGAAILWPPLDESVYGKAPMYMTAYEEVIGLPGDVFVGGEDDGCRVA